MEDFFTAFSSEDSIAFLLSVLVCFLIGFLTGWLLYGGRAKRHRKEGENWKKKYDDLVLQHTELREEIDLKEADLVRARREANDALSYAKSLEADKEQWQSDLDTALENSVRAQANVASYQTTIDDLNNQIIGLKARIAELSGENPGSSFIVAGHPGDEETAKRLSDLETRIAQLSAEKDPTGDDQLEDVRQSYEIAVKRIEALEEKMNTLVTTNPSHDPDLSSGLESNINGNGEEEVIIGGTNRMTSLDKGESIALTAVAAREEILAANGEKWPTASEETKDDLTRINGIGSFLEKKLNSLGIYTYEQLSYFTPYWIERLTAAIEFFPGRIERDDWVGQAGKLHKTKDTGPTELADKTAEPEDLKIVEGIGPKIESLLKENGIGDLATLAQTTEDKLRNILNDAGSSYRMHDPTTWPVQAELASKGEWETLGRLQARLSGGNENE